MNIGLIAMNGIRVYDPEIAGLGLSLPGFLDRGKALASMPSLGLLTLAGMTPERHHIEYVEVPDIKQVSGVPGHFDVVAISSYSAQIGEAYELADRYRALGIPTIIGGPHVSCLPEEGAMHADAVSIGEGEPTWNSILEDAERGRLEQYYGSRYSKFELKDSPCPAYELLQPAKYNRLSVQTSRGCPHRCEFCAASPLIANKYKQKPIEKVLQEIDKIASIWKRPFIEFVDDNCFVNRDYWNALLPELAKRNIRWFAETDISIAEDLEFLDAIANAGCMQVLIGLESPVVEGMDGIELHNNWKLRKFWQYKAAIRRIQSRGIRVIGCFILGLDGHTPRVAEDIYNFASELDLFDVQVTIQTPFPGTPLYSRLQTEGRLLQETNWAACTLFDINFRPSHMTAEELKDTFKDLLGRLYSDDAYNRRRRAYKSLARQPLTAAAKAQSA